MIKSIIIAISAILLTSTIVSAQQYLPVEDQQQIINNLNTLTQAINEGNTEKIAKLIAPNNQTLKSEIQNVIKGEIKYQLDYSPFNKNIQIQSPNKVKVNTVFAAKGIGWTISGLPTHFVFEKENNQWLITSTDFHKKLGSDYIRQAFKWILMIIGPLSMLACIFWTWMLIDCIRRNFDEKLLWLIVLLFTNILGAIIYFFTIKKKNITKKPLEYKA